MVDAWPDKKLNLEVKTTEVTEANKKKFEDINTTIKSNPDQLEKVSKDSLSSLKDYLKEDKNSAIAMLYNTLEALKNPDKLENDDRKSLEKIRDMILTEEKICTMEDVWAYQLKTEVFNDTFDLVALKKYGKLFNTWSTLTRFGNIKDTYEPNKYADFDKLFDSGEFKNKDFTRVQFQKELYTKNTERMTKLVADLKALDIVDFLTKNTAKVASLDKLTNNTELTTPLETKFPTMVHGLYEFNYLLEKNPAIMVTWKAALDTKKAAETEVVNKKILETITKDFTADKVLEKYLVANKNVKDAAYTYNMGKDSKLAETITTLNKQITLVPSDTKVSTLIDFLKAGELAKFQEFIYTDVNLTSSLTNPYDNKIGPETYSILDRYINKLDPLTKMPMRVGNGQTSPTETKTTTSTTETSKTTTETAPSAAEIKKTLGAFDASKVNVILYSWVTATDYKTLFTAVSTKGTDAQVIAANAYMTALTTKDQNLNGATTDKQPGILTFKTICKALGQTDVYTTVKARIDKVAADKAAAENTVEAPETLSVGGIDYKFTDNPKTKTLEVRYKNSLMDDYYLTTYKYDDSWILTSVEEPGRISFKMPAFITKTDVFTYGIVPIHKIQSAWLKPLIDADTTMITVSVFDGSVYYGTFNDKAGFKEWSRYQANWSYESWTFNGPTLIAGTNYNAKTWVSKEIWTPTANFADIAKFTPKVENLTHVASTTSTEWYRQQVNLKKQFPKS